MKKLTILFGFVAILSMLSGCAMTNSQVPLNYQMTQPAKNAHYSKQHTALNIAKTTDNRDVENPKSIIHKTNLYNQTTSGNYLAEKPIAKIVNDALSTSFKQIGYREDAKSSQYELTSSIESVDLKTIMGFVKGTVEIDIMLNIQAINKATGDLVWQQNVKGNGKVTTAWGGDSTLRAAFDQALTNAMYKLQRSNTLYHALNKK